MSPKQIKLEGFTNKIEDDDHLVIACHGLEGSGKTRFLTTLPGPVAIVPCDRKSRRTVEKEIQLTGRKDVWMTPEDFIRHANPIELSLMNEKKAMEYYSDHVKRIMEACYRALAHGDIRSIALDGGSQLWEDILFKHYGRNQRIMPRDRGPANQDMIDFLAAMTGKHFVVTLKSKAVWKDDKPTDKLEPAGMTNMGYHVNVILRMENNKRFNPNVDRPEFNWQFRSVIEHCHSNAMLQIQSEDNVMKDEMVSFQYLAALIFPDKDQSEFQMELD